MRYEFEERFNIHIYCYGDLPQLKEAVYTIPDDVKVHVFDGRYIDFEGNSDLTPGAREWCGLQGNVIYHRPPDSMLPFGKYGSSDHRYSQHEKGCWANYLVLPSDQWTLQMDTDERLIRLNRDIFDDFQDEFRYRPSIPTDDGRNVTQPRIWKPKYWTLWIDDTAIPRDKVSRDTPLEELRKEWHNHRGVHMEHIDEEKLLIENYGMARPEDYNRRRVDHLKDINREHRANILEHCLDVGYDIPEDWHESYVPAEGMN